MWAGSRLSKLFSSKQEPFLAAEEGCFRGQPITVENNPPRAGL